MQTWIITCWAATTVHHQCSKGMSTKLNRFFRFKAGAFVLAQALAAAGALAQGATTSVTPPVSILRVAADNPANFGFRPIRPGHAPPPPFGTTFLVTNHTSATVAINLTGIELKAGSNWIKQSTPHGPLLLSASNALPTRGSTKRFMPTLTTTQLLPHQAAYATISLSGATNKSGPTPGSHIGVGMNYLAVQPTGAVWRVVVSVQEKLTGLADASARITRYPDTQSRLAANGVTNAPVNPFSGAYSDFGRPTRVESQEVSTQ
jgi:hypothetical protein